MLLLTFGETARRPPETWPGRTMDREAVSGGPFRCRTPFPLGGSSARCCLLADRRIDMSRFRKRRVLGITPRTLALLTHRTFRSTSFVLHPTRRRRITSVLHSPRTDRGSGCITLRFLHGSSVTTGNILPAYRSANATVVINGGKRHM